ncbi:MAG: (Fe-S)-binding protein [Anaerolineae bacterium]|nr:(Fe-S)-binding protein [Anaerolineae bacterium]
MPPPVQLFITCLVDSLFPAVGQAVVTVLARAGAQVQLPAGQTCCGQPAFNAGYQQQARQMAAHTIAVLEASQGPVVLPSGSCAAMLKHGYLELFAADPAWLPRAQALAARVYEFSQYLVDELQVTDFGAEYAGKLAYHSACHLSRGLGIERQPLELLENVDGAQVHPLAPECCGFGGLFSVTQTPVSAEMLARRLQHIAAANADVVVACDVSCLMHIEGGLRKQGAAPRCAHLAQVLAGQPRGLR